MASITRVATGWRVQIKLKGVRDSKVFPTKREATTWGAIREAEILENLQPETLKPHTLLDAFRRYAKEVSPKKKGERWEKIRLLAFEKQDLPTSKRITEIIPNDIAEFRDLRLESVTGASVRREMILLNSVFEVARKEWGWIKENPCKDVNKPSSGRPRDRVLQWWEVRRMLRQVDYRVGQPTITDRQKVAAVFMFAMRTGMRAGEICQMDWKDVKADHYRLPDSKNDDARLVPITSKAARVLKSLEKKKMGSVFGINGAYLDASFRRVRAAAGLEGFTFHDTRHTAATMFAKKVDVLDLCKIMGWRNVKQALSYYNPTISSLTAKLS